VKEIGDGVLIEADLAKGVIKNKTENKTYYTKSFPSFLQKIIEKGGLINWIRDKKQ
jgi:3-isopropylmalate/(R)-2-methylmalate dehydratase small subunit